MKLKILFIASMIGTIIAVASTIPDASKRRYLEEQDSELNKLRSERIELYLDSIGQH